MLLLLIILVLLFGGGGGYYGYSRWGTGGGLGILGTVLLIVLVVYLLGGQLDREMVLRRVDGRPRGFHGLLEDLGERHAPAGEADLAGADPARIHEVVDEPHHLRELAAHHVARTPGSLRRAERLGHEGVTTAQVLGCAFNQAPTVTTPWTADPETGVLSRQRITAGTKPHLQGERTGQLENLTP